MHRRFPSALVSASLPSDHVLPALVLLAFAFELRLQRGELGKGRIRIGLLLGAGRRMHRSHGLLETLTVASMIVSLMLVPAMIAIPPGRTLAVFGRSVRSLRGGRTHVACPEHTGLGSRLWFRRRLAGIANPELAALPCAVRIAIPRLAVCLAVCLAVSLAVCPAVPAAFLSVRALPLAALEARWPPDLDQNGLDRLRPYLRHSGFRLRCHAFMEYCSVCIQFGRRSRLDVRLCVGLNTCLFGLAAGVVLDDRLGCVSGESRLFDDDPGMLLDRGFRQNQSPSRLDGALPAPRPHRERPRSARRRSRPR